MGFIIGYVIGVVLAITFVIVIDLKYNGGGR